jgi:hypothetical protein
MNRFREYALKAAGFSGLYLGLSMLDSAPAGAGPTPGPPQQDVTVVNGATNPVPVAAQGTTTVAGTVNIGNTPTVALAGTPSVTVSGTPTVALAGPTTVTLAPGGSVAVGNTVVVRDSDNPGRNGVSFLISAGGYNASGQPGQLYTVPAGKRFVLESISASGVVDHGRTMHLSLFSPPGTASSLPCVLIDGSGTVGPTGPLDGYVCNLSTRAYLDPGAVITPYVTANGTDAVGWIWADVTVSGTLVSSQ